MGKCDFFFSPPSLWVAKLFNHLCEYVNLNADGTDLGFFITVNVVVGLIIASFQCQFIPIQPENMSTGSWLNFGKMSCSVTSDTKNQAKKPKRFVLAGCSIHSWYTQWWMGRPSSTVQYIVQFAIKLTKCSCKPGFLIQAIHCSSFWQMFCIDNDLNMCSFFPIHLPDPLSSLLFPPLTS